jgi:hypothetical protein
LRSDWYNKILFCNRPFNDNSWDLIDTIRYCIDILLYQSDLKNYHWMVNYKTISYCVNQISIIIIEWSITKQYLIVSIRSQELSLNGQLQNNILLYQSDLKNYHWMVYYKTISYCINQSDLKNCQHIKAQFNIEPNRKCLQFFHGQNSVNAI